MHAATSKVENSAQGLSCRLMFVHGLIGVVLVTQRASQMGILDQVLTCKLKFAHDHEILTEGEGSVQITSLY